MTGEAAVARADEYWQRLRGILDGLPADAWAAPTPCAGWDVKDLVGHMSAITLLFAGRPQPDPPAGWTPPEGLRPIDRISETLVAARRGWSVEQVAAEVAEAHAADLERLRGIEDWDAPTQGPVGQTTQQGLAEVRMFDLWVHLWDLGEAIGQPVDLTDDSAAAVTCHRHVLDHVPWMYGKVAQAPEGAGVTLRLGAPLDEVRAVRVVDGRARWVEDRPADTVTVLPAAYTLLVAGRRTVDELADAISWEGDEADRLVSRGRLW